MTTRRPRIGKSARLTAARALDVLRGPQADYAAGLAEIEDKLTDSQRATVRALRAVAAGRRPDVESLALAPGIAKDLGLMARKDRTAPGAKLTRVPRGAATRRGARSRKAGERAATRKGSKPMAKRKKGRKSSRPKTKTVTKTKWRTRAKAKVRRRRTATMTTRGVMPKIVVGAGAALAAVGAGWLARKALATQSGQTQRLSAIAAAAGVAAFGGMLVKGKMGSTVRNAAGLAAGILTARELLAFGQSRGFIPPAAPAVNVPIPEGSVVAGWTTWREAQARSRALPYGVTPGTLTARGQFATVGV